MANPTPSISREMGDISYTTYTPYPTDTAYSSSLPTPTMVPYPLYRHTPVYGASYPPGLNPERVSYPPVIAGPDYSMLRLPEGMAYSTPYGPYYPPAAVPPTPYLPMMGRPTFPPATVLPTPYPPMMGHSPISPYSSSYTRLSGTAQSYVTLHHTPMERSITSTSELTPPNPDIPELPPTLSLPPPVIPQIPNISRSITLPRDHSTSHAAKSLIRSTESRMLGISTAPASTTESSSKLKTNSSLATATRNPYSETSSTVITSSSRDEATNSFSDKEITMLLELADLFGDGSKNWNLIGLRVGKPAEVCKEYYETIHQKKDPLAITKVDILPQYRRSFTEEEDSLILRHVKRSRNCPETWEKLAEIFGRTARSCRSRYNEYLKKPIPKTREVDSSYTSADITTIQEHLKGSSKPNYTYLSKILGRSAKAIQTYVRRHPLLFNKLKQPNGPDISKSASLSYRVSPRSAPLIPPGQRKRTAPETLPPPKKWKRTPWVTPKKQNLN